MQISSKLLCRTNRLTFFRWCLAFFLFIWKTRRNYWRKTFELLTNRTKSFDFYFFSFEPEVGIKGVKSLNESHYLFEYRRVRHNTMYCCSNYHTKFVSYAKLLRHEPWIRPCHIPTHQYNRSMKFYDHHQSLWRHNKRCKINNLPLSICDNTSKKRVVINLNETMKLPNWLKISLEMKINWTLKRC